MTRDELLAKLRECQELARTDFEMAEVHATRALLEYVADPDIARAFEAIGER